MGIEVQENDIFCLVEGLRRVLLSIRTMGPESRSPTSNCQILNLSVDVALDPEP